MHSFVTLSLSILTTAAVAQPTLQSTDFPSSIILNWYLLTDPGSVTEPTDGTGQTWDFTSATWAPAGTVNIGPAAGTPYAALYPAANYVFITTPTGQASVYAYLLVGTNDIEVICGDAPFNTEVYTNYKTILATPLAYGADFSDTNDGTQGPGNETWTYTGAGDLLTGYGNFPNTVKTIRTADDRISLWNSAPLFPRITGNSQAVNLYIDASTSISDLDRQVTALQVFPTIATSELTVKSVGAGSTWTIIDGQGRAAGSGSFNTQGDHQLSIGELVPGAYILNVLDASGIRSARFEKH